MKFWLKFLVVTGIQVACLVGMIGYKYSSLVRGRKVLLEVPRPKDPRSLFRGDYVIIRYAINELDMETIPGDTEGLGYGSTIYVELEEVGDVWKPKRVTGVKPENAELFIRGRITNLVKSNKLYVNFSPNQIATFEQKVRDYENRFYEEPQTNINMSNFEEIDLDDVRYFSEGEDLVGPKTSRSDLKPGRTIYINMWYNNNGLAPGSITQNPDEDTLDFFIEGTIMKSVPYRRINVEYGIESLFVPEGTGYDMEDRLREVQKAWVSIDPSGHAMVVGVPEPQPEPEEGM